MGIAALLPLVIALPASWAGKTGAATVSVLEYSQCQNGASPSTATTCSGGWGNGILNSSNSHYSEDEVTPQRVLMSTASGSAHTITLRYMTRKGSAGAHAYDSLTTWNTTQTGAVRCQGIKTTDCPMGAASTLPVPADPTPVNPAASGISNRTDAHELPGGVFTMYGGTLGKVVSGPTHDTAATSDTADDYASITLSFTATSTRTELLFGGHLAASTGDRGWGTGMGSASISGGPYHIILAAVDGASIGSRDNQIQSSAIQAGSPRFTVTKTATPSNPKPGDTVSYTVTVGNTGTIAGATSFTDNFDDRLSPSTPAASPTGGSCAREAAGSADRLFTCSTSLIDPGKSQVFTYTAVMPGGFTSGDGTGGCPSGSFPVRNDVTEATGAMASATVCVVAAPDFIVTKTVDNPSAGPTVTVHYTIVVTNQGKASGATTWTDDFDERVTNVSNATSPGQPDCAPTLTGNHEFASCPTGQLAAGASQTWTYSAVMPASFSGAPGGQGCTSTSANPTYPVRNVVVLGNDASDDALVCVPAKPSFTVTKTANPTVQSPGLPVTYTIRIHNGGTASGTTTWTDDFDDSVTNVSTATDGSDPACAPDLVSADHRFTCTSGTIAAGGDQTWTYTATMPASFPTAPASGCTGSTTTSPIYPVRNVVTLANGNTGGATVCVAAAPRFTVSKSASPTTQNPGLPVTYTIVISNTGTAPGTTGWTDDFDDSVTGVTNATTPGQTACAPSTSHGTRAFVCTTGTIAPGSSQTWTYTANMPGGFTGAPAAGCSGSTSTNPIYPIHNVVTLADNATDDATVCVPGAPSFTVVKTASPAVVGHGGTVTYTVTIHNGGTAPGATTWTDVPGKGVTGLSDASSPGQPSCSPANGRYSCSSGTIAAGADGVWTYTATMPQTFTGSPDPQACGTSTAADPQYPVRNVVTLGNDASDDATVCVQARPDLSVTKTASTTSAQPGDTVTYTVVVANTGSAEGSTAWTDDFDDRVTNVSNAVATGQPDCAPTLTGNHEFSCPAVTVPAGGAVTWTYTAKLPTAFSGAPAGAGCPGSSTTDAQYPVRNVVVLASGDSDQATVCVHAHPDLSLVKSVTTSQTNGQQVLTYTITYTNNGHADAPTATIGDGVPAGTTYSSCSANCAVNGSPVTGVTWTVGPIAANGGTGSVSLTVVVSTTSLCSVTNTATITAYGDNGGNPKSSNTLATPVTPMPDPDHAHASGDAFGAQITTYTLLDGLLSPVTKPLNAPVASSQSGVGTSGPAADQALSVSVPALLSADVMGTTSTSSVTRSPAVASDTSTSEVAKLCVVPVPLLNYCAVSADAVRAVAHASASGTAASVSSSGSQIVGLKIAGVATPVDLSQTTKIDLPDLFGSGSYVLINGHTGGTSTSGGSRRADMTVNMIQVHITGTLGLVKADITVGHATAHADFPVLALCGGQTTANVSGHAFIASAAVLPPLVQAVQGFVGIPASGGSEQQNVTSDSLVNGQLLTTGVATTSSIGSNSGTGSTSTARAEIANVCLLQFPGSSVCAVTADAVKSVSTTTANGTAASKDQVSATDATTLTNLKVRTSPTATAVSVAANVAPNSTIDIAGIGFLVLNEQVCDDGTPVSATNPRCTGTAHSGLTVSALHLVLLHQLGPFSPGVEVVLAQAHSDATFG